MTYKEECRHDCLVVFNGRAGPPFWVKVVMFEILWFLGEFHPRLMTARWRILKVRLRILWCNCKLAYYSLVQEVYGIRLFILFIYHMLGIKLDGPKN